MCARPNRRLDPEAATDRTTEILAFQGPAGLRGSIFLAGLFCLVQSIDFRILLQRVTKRSSEDTYGLHFDANVLLIGNLLEL